VFVQSGVQINPSFESSIRQYYNGTVENVDFENRESMARAVVNRWVRKQTQGQIPNLLEIPVPAETKILLVNALALRAEWKTKFECSQTADKGIFHPDSKTKLV
jgi:serine protease inhibitor